MLGQKLGRYVKSKKNLVYPLENTVLIQSSRNFIRILIIIISRSSSKLGHLGSKTRSPGQILKKNLVYTLEGTVSIQSS